jgi:hypothetical protein
MPLGHSAAPCPGGFPQPTSMSPSPLKGLLQTRPKGRPGVGPRRADDGIRTRDPHLGKVMRYQLRYVRMVVTVVLDPPPRCVSGL